MELCGLLPYYSNLHSPWYGIRTIYSLSQIGFDVNLFYKSLAAKNGDSIPTLVATKFHDVASDAWYSGYVKYLSGYGIIAGSGGTLFEPDREITRAEFVTLAVRFYSEYANGVELTTDHATFNDVRASYWAASYIDDAAGYGWITGYEDGSFRAANRITRAEVVTIVNRVLDREPDTAYLGKNLALMTTFSDVPKTHWAWYYVLEAANTHTAILGENETWVK